MKLEPIFQRDDPPWEFWVWFEMRGNNSIAPYTRYSGGYNKMLIDAENDVPEAVNLRRQLEAEIVKERLKS